MAVIELPFLASLNLTTISEQTHLGAWKYKMSNTSVTARLLIVLLEMRTAWTSTYW
jgi:hypothetical protein